MVIKICKAPPDTVFFTSCLNTEFSRRFFFLIRYYKSLAHCMHIFLYKWTMHGKSPSVTTDPNTVQNLYKLLDFVRRIKLTRAILLLTRANFLRNSTIDFCIFLYLVTCFPRVTVSLLCRLQAVLKIQVNSNTSLSN